MLYITFNSGDTREWHVSEPSPIRWDEAHAIREIQADGHELDHIRNMFCFSPEYVVIPRGRVVRLFGDLAKTIVANL
jgi:hypothetical protein